VKRQVGDVMTVDVATVGPATPFKDLVRSPHQHRVSAVPVVDDQGRLLGLVSEVDLALKQEHRPGDRAPSSRERPPP
jgi:CBS domain-containing protein